MRPGLRRLKPRAYLQTVAMHVELCHWYTSDVDVLDLLGGDVLTLRQLEDMLLPVDDLQRAILHEEEPRCINQQL